MLRYIVTWISYTEAVKREVYYDPAKATKRMKFLQAHGRAATLEVE